MRPICHFAYSSTTRYWYHPDHLGSASWMTDTNGTAYQHLQYMPWGEPLLDQRKSGYTYNSRYTFSGKERDEETGYSYFGARHYHSDLSIWLSVDPMADKYPSTSPYAYCANNPVMIKDPNGAYGVIVLQEEQNRDIVWRGKVRFQLHLPGKATLRMTYYYSTGTTAGSLSDEQISYVKDNIAGNFNPLVGQSISVGGNKYAFNYQIDFVAMPDATKDDLETAARNTTYRSKICGNYIFAKTLNDVGEASDIAMYLDFAQIEAKIKTNDCDGQTPTHELGHNLGAYDTHHGGTHIMDYYSPTKIRRDGVLIYEDYPNRTIQIQDMQNIINNPHYNNRINIISW